MFLTLWGLVGMASIVNSHRNTYGKQHVNYYVAILFHKCCLQRRFSEK